MRKVDILLFSLLIGVLVPLEVWCAFLTYETIGEVARVVYFAALALNLPLIVLGVRYRLAAALAAFALGAAVIPYQLVLCSRLLRVQKEAASIVAHVYEERLKTGKYPADLRSYVFRDPGMKPYIQGYELTDDGGGFLLTYRVGTESTSHWYHPKDGWGYYPD
ncbi:MAG: hypothetical protein FJ291_13035 [Planctomycetes bacterium]|nr:hypothetical protein [Planctomycetota bacterium]